MLGYLDFILIQQIINCLEILPFDGNKSLAEFVEVKENCILM